MDETNHLFFKSHESYINDEINSVFEVENETAETMEEHNSAIFDEKMD